MEEIDRIEMVKEIDKQIGSTIMRGSQKEDLETLINTTAKAAEKPGFFKKIYNRFFNK